jgi:hypothetical protein
MIPMKFKPCLFLTLLLGLSACVRSAPGTAYVPATASPTVSSPTASQTPVPASPTPEPPTPTVTGSPLSIDGMQAVEAKHQSAYPYIFLYDPYTWQPGDSSNCQSCLVLLEFTNLNLSGCSFQVNPGLEFSTASSSDVTLGVRTWQVNLNADGTRSQYVSSWSDQAPLDILAEGISDPTCRSDVEEVLAHTYYTWEVKAMRLPSGLPTPGPLDLPADYTCSSLPPRLRIGDAAQVIVDSVWVRSAPRRSEDTQILLLHKDQPLSLIINSGPVCAEGLTFWNVRYYAGSEYTGWVAEGDDQEYFLEAIRP